MSANRESHKVDVLDFLHQEFPGCDWDLALPPHGTGHEAYFARSGTGEYFVKLGVEPDRYRVLSGLGVAPSLVASGSLTDGVTLVVQEKIDGRLPSRQDFKNHLAQFADIIRKTHHRAALKHILPHTPSASFREAGLESLARVEQRWDKLKHLVPNSRSFVENSLRALANQIGQFAGGGLVASHNDPCNGNWLVDSAGKVYLLDYESMSLDDPALDLGALLWWYYPPPLRAEFLEIAGYRTDATLGQRMKIRMALHCLNILLPRKDSFDRFNADSFDDALEDFKAVLAGKQNPQGYQD